MLRRIAPTAVLTAVALSCCPLQVRAQDTVSIVPDADNLEEWIGFIRPTADELSYEGIGWRNAFWPAVQEARALGRPILLWTMNGHPLGCT